MFPRQIPILFRTRNDRRDRRSRRRARHARLAAAPNVTTVAWSPCHRDLGLLFECGQVQVPLDHDDPGGAVI